MSAAMTGKAEDRKRYDALHQGGDGQTEDEGRLDEAEAVVNQ